MGLCMICKKPPTRNRLSADHCHDTMKPRALLCDNCNLGLGSFMDNIHILESAIEYLRLHNGMS